MSRILDYILEPNVVYTNGAFLIKVKVEDSYKYKKLLVTDNMKYSTLKGSTFFFFNATNQNNASCLDIEGNTFQQGTPSPTSPVEVDNVSKDNNIVVTGENLFNGIFELGTINSSGANQTSTSIIRTKDLIGISPNTAYTLVNPSGVTGIILYYYKDNVYLGTSSPALKEDKSLNFTSRAGANQLRWRYNTGYTTLENEVMLLRGTIGMADIPPYIPYQGSSYRIDLGGKNIMIPKIISATNNGITATYDQDTQTFTFNGTCTANNTTFTLGDNAVNFKTGITRSSVHYVGGSVTSYCQIRNFDNDYSYSCNYSILGLSESNPVIYATSQYDFVCPRDRLSNIRFNSGSVATNFQIKVMVADSLDTTYSPYVSNPIELCKIGDYADTLKKARGINVAQFTTTKDTSKYTYSSFIANNISVNKTATGGSFYASFILHIPYAGTYAITGNALGTQQLYIYTDSLWGTLKESFAVQAGDFNRGTIFDSAGDYIIGLYGSATGNYSVKNFMCFEGVTAEPYEPYIVKNLFNKNDTPVETEKYINGAGTISSNINFSIFKVFLKPNTTYTITNSGGASNPRYGTL